MRRIPLESDLPVISMFSDRDNTYQAIHRERVRAHAKHVEKGLSMEIERPDSPRWLPVLVEEVGEVARALNDNESLGNLRKELIQCAAMCVAWVEALDL